MSQRLGDLLIREQILTPAQLEQALAYQTRNGGRLGTCLVQLRFCTEEQVANALSRQYGVRSVNLAEVDPPAAVLRLISRQTAERYSVFPLSRQGTTLTLAMADPTNIFALDDVKFMTGLNIEPMVATESAILEAITKAYSIQGGMEEGEFQELIDALDDGQTQQVELEETESESEVHDLERAAGEAPVVRLVNLVMTEAVRLGASDIHVECYENTFRIRYRIDGMLREGMALPMKLRDPMISRIKIMARLDISEKRLPQDGRIMMRMQGEGKRKTLDLRVSTLPTLFGEKVVLRLLDKENLRLDMTKLGFEPDSLARFQEAIRRPYGMVLVTGPTGSGKTNTLYSSIAQLNTPDINIMTAEDPVEFQLPGVNQVQMKEQIGLNFAAALRSFLRQDPNIILVGEIRDFETAEIAVKAALTGHLVLSTLHTNDAPSAVTRLMNMGVEPFLVATSVHLICAQRLIRRICSQCKVPRTVALRDLLDLGYTPEEAKDVAVFEGKGCPNCNNTGYKGRVGLYEVMSVDEELRDLILVGASATELKRKAVERGMLTLRRSGLEKVKQGVTTIAEVVRETVR